MNIISPQTSCSSISSDVITITPTDTITLTNHTGSSLYYTGTGIGGGSSSTITISNGGSSGSGFTVGAGTGYEWSIPAEFDGCFPAWSRIEDMCKQYPALAIAFEKFKITYYLVKDDYDNPKD